VLIAETYLSNRVAGFINQFAEIDQLAGCRWNIRSSSILQLSLWIQPTPCFARLKNIQLSSARDEHINELEIARVKATWSLPAGNIWRAMRTCIAGGLATGGVCRVGMEHSRRCEGGFRSLKSKPGNANINDLRVLTIWPSRGKRGGQYGRFSANQWGGA